MPKIVTDEEIFEAVIEVVTERGYAGATTKQMAEVAQVGEVTLFRKYGTKLELVKQAIVAFAAEMHFEEASRYTGELEADLLRVVQAYQDASTTYGQFFPIILSELPRYPELAELLDTPLSMVGGIAQLLSRYQAEGQLREEHPLHAVAGLLGPLLITAMIRGAMPEGPMPLPDLSVHVARFLDGRRIPVEVLG